MFWRIATPIAAGGTIVIATLALIGVWSDCLVTFTMIDRDTSMTMSVGIRKLLRMSYAMALSPKFRGKFAGEASDTALLPLAALPVIVFYAALQRWFMRGLTEGAVKFWRKKGGAQHRGDDCCAPGMGDRYQLLRDTVRTFTQTLLMARPAAPAATGETLFSDRD